MLREKLIKLQTEMGMSDYQFARFLDVPRSTWQRTHSGDIPMGATVARAVREKIPRLRSDAERFLITGQNADGGEAA